MKAPAIEQYFGHGYHQLYKHYLLPPEQSAAEARFLARKLRPRAGQRWLDMPCGFGRHLLALRALRPALALFGGDLHRRFLGEDGLRAAAGVCACDMRRLPFADASFDGVLNLLNSFGYYPPATRGKAGGKTSPKKKALDDLDILSEWARVLRPGGRLVLDLANRRALVGLVARQPVIRYCGGDYETIEQFEWDPAREIMSNRTLWRWPEGEEHAAYRLRLYTPAQMRRLLADAGFELSAVFGDFSGHGFDPYQSERMLILARRSAE